MILPSVFGKKVSSSWSSRRPTIFRRLFHKADTITEKPCFQHPNRWSKENQRVPTLLDLVQQAETIRASWSYKNFDINAVPLQHKFFNLTDCSEGMDAWPFIRMRKWKVEKQIPFSLSYKAIDIEHLWNNSLKAKILILKQQQILFFTGLGSKLKWNAWNLSEQFPVELLISNNESIVPMTQLGCFFS